jgi:DNA-binding beta-propeller fold protein YncE
MSPDGRDRAAQFSKSSVFSDLDVVPFDESVWVSDYFNRRVYHVDIDGDVMEEIELSGYPIAIAVDDYRARVWVSQTEPAALVRYTAGRRDAYYEMSDYPLDMSIDQEGGTLWGCSPGGGTVMRVDDSGLVRSSGHDSPRSIIFDPVARVSWVATRSALISLNSQFEQMMWIGGFSYPEDISLDMDRGHLWIADTGNSRVVKYSRDGQVLLEVNGLTEPYSLAVDTETEECWIADSYEGEVIRISGEGDFIKRKGGFLSPFGIAIIP